MNPIDAFYIGVWSIFQVIQIFSGIYFFTKRASYSGFSYSWMFTVISFIFIPTLLTISLIIYSLAKDSSIFLFRFMPTLICLLPFTFISLSIMLFTNRNISENRELLVYCFCSLVSSGFALSTVLLFFLSG